LLALWSDDDWEAAMTAMVRAMDGVGDRERVHIDPGTVALHFRRAMTPSEFLGLPRKRGEIFPIERAS
jgi:hypothetical protein